MSHITRLLLPSLTLLLLLPRGGAGEPAKPSATAVVELFTSQGCSSCPPADRLLARLARDPRFQGRVIPLSFHVDYWDHIGWKDPYSSSRWSERQRHYAARVFRTNRIYTPQVVVNGSAECVGSHEGKVLDRINAALASEPAGRVSLAVEPPTPDGHLRIRVEAKLAKPAGPGTLDLWVAVYESGLSTDVKAGENSSRTLHNDRVVRRFEKALTLSANAGSERSTSLVLGLDKRWREQNLGVAAFLQDPQTLAIHGAAAREVGR